MGDADAAIVVKGEGMAAAQSTMAAQRQQAKAEYTAAYNSSEAATAFTNPQYAPEFSQILTNSLKEFRGGVGGAPATFRLLDEAMDQLANGASVQSLFDLRKAMVKQQAAGGVESGAATALKNGLDDVLNQQMERNLLYGNPASIAKGLEAIGKFKDFQNVWNSKGILKTLTAQEMRDGELSLIVSPKEAANKILGTGIAKTTNQKDLARDLLTLKKQLPLAQWDEVRQEAFILLAETLQPSAMAEKQASLQFNKAWRNMKNSNNTLTKLLFNKDEIGMIDKLALLVVSFIVSILTWKFIEQPFRHPAKRNSAVKAIVPACILLVLMFGVSLVIRKCDGFPGRLPWLNGDVVTRV
jgi:hypothetical protein